MAGVYNGLAWQDPSHRAALPSLHRIFIAPPADAPANATQALGGAVDYQRAIYFNRTRVDLPGCAATVVETALYAHHALREVLVFEIAASGGPGWAGCTLPVASDVVCAGFNDTDLAPLSAGGGGAPAVWAGHTLVAEEPGLPLRSVAIAMDAWGASAPAQLVLTPAAPRLLLRGVYRSDLDVPGAASPADVAVAAAAQWVQVAAMAPDALRASHEAAWAALHASGGVELAGNVSFALTVNASLYDILSSLRADWPWMQSPGSLATDGYAGHGFCECARVRARAGGSTVAAATPAPNRPPPAQGTLRLGCSECVWGWLLFVLHYFPRRAFRVSPTPPPPSLSALCSTSSSLTSRAPSRNTGWTDCPPLSQTQYLRVIRAPCGHGRAPSRALGRRRAALATSMKTTSPRTSLSASENSGMRTGTRRG